jgi:ATP-dependent DNA helicase Rep
MPSRFLDELPDDVVQWEGRGDESDKVKKEQGKASLSALKAMLNN